MGIDSSALLDSNTLKNTQDCRTPHCCDLILTFLDSLSMIKHIHNNWIHINIICSVVIIENSFFGNGGFYDHPKFKFK